MKQLLQNLQSGELLLADVPAPMAKPGHLLIRTTRSLISAGTERMLTDFAKASYIQKARQQPDKVKQVLDKVKTDGLAATYESVKSKLEQPIPMGYCNAGQVLAVGDGVIGYNVGDRVVSNGNHAEVVCVPQNLCARIPEGVSDDRAAFTVLASIALQGIRLCQPTLGERIAVFGLGLIGLAAVQLLKANGCRVIGFDFASDRVDMARSFGVEAVDLSTGADPVQAAMAFSAQIGIDAVLITAATKSNELISQAAQMSRQRGRVVLTGVVGLDLRRADFYEKELSFQVSCSYGPGRYDASYEDQGNDYPIGYVRWTEQRNLQAVLEAIASGALDVDPLISGEYDFLDIHTAYQSLDDRKNIGTLLKYPENTDDQALMKRSVSISDAHKSPASGTPASASGPSSGIRQCCIGVIGAGQFTQLKILPGLKKAGANIKSIASAGGVSGSIAASKHGIANCTTDYKTLLQDDEISAVFVTTRHNSHARFVLEALAADKDVFVEKPLCLNPAELGDIEQSFNASAQRRGTEPILMVGFNRRFSPYTQQIVDLLRSRQNPLAATFTCNAGHIPADHWVHDPLVGGGRVIGEVCHFIDYLAFLANSPVKRVSAMKQAAKSDVDLEDIVVVQLVFDDGSIGNVNYFSNGSKAFAKERCEVYFDGNVAVLDNFRSAQAYGKSSIKKKWLSKMDKGHNAQFEAVVNAMTQGLPSPVSFASTLNSMKATFAAVESMRTNQMIDL